MTHFRYTCVEYLIIALAVYFVAGAITSFALPLVVLPLWLVDALSRCFEGVFVGLFGQW